VALQILELLTCAGLTELEELPVPVDPHGAGLRLTRRSECGDVPERGFAEDVLLLVRESHGAPWCGWLPSSTPTSCARTGATRPESPHTQRSGPALPAARPARRWYVPARPGQQESTRKG